MTKRKKKVLRRFKVTMTVEVVNAKQLRKAALRCIAEIPYLCGDIAHMEEDHIAMHGTDLTHFNIDWALLLDPDQCGLAVADQIEIKEIDS